MVLKDLAPMSWQNYSPDTLGDEELEGALQAQEDNVWERQIAARWDGVQNS